MTTLAPAREGMLESYEAPRLELAEYRDDIHEEQVVWWAVLLGFSYAAALAYAAYCTSKGGSPSISLTWKGFKVTCYR